MHTVRRLTRPLGADVVGQALAGDADAWGELVARHNRQVVVAMLAAGPSLDQAEDIAQETWLRWMQQQKEGRFGYLENACGQRIVPKDASGGEHDRIAAG